MKGSTMRQEVSAGGVIYRKRGGEIEIVFIKDGFKRWTFPKGHLEKNEKPQEAARREIAEEIGLKDLKIVSDLGKINYWYKETWACAPAKKPTNDLVNKTVFWFLFEASGQAKLMRQKNEVLDAKWFSIKKALKTPTYRNSQNVLKRALKKIKAG